MDIENIKCVMLIDEALPLGRIANTAAVMGATLGRLFPGAIGPDVFDQGGNRHAGIIAIPIPILKGAPAQLRELRQKLYEPRYEGLTVIDFSETAGSCNTYDVFTETMAETPAGDLRYCGIALCGNKKLINQLTGSLALLR